MEGERLTFVLYSYPKICLLDRLYRRLLRLHRKLPDEMRYLGDSYVKSGEQSFRSKEKVVSLAHIHSWCPSFPLLEFHRTRSTDNPLHIIGFLSQWKLYLDEVEQSVRQPGQPFQGRQLKEDLFDKVRQRQEPWSRFKL